MMKRIIVIFIVLSSTMLSFGQGLVSGVGGAYGTEISYAGVNIREYYFLNEHICFGPEASYFPKHKQGEYDKSLLELNFSVHYIFEATENLGIYPLTGINYSIEKESMLPESKTVKAFGINLGGGIHYRIKNLFPFIEYKYITGDLAQHVYSVGILFSFKNTKEENHTKK